MSEITCVIDVILHFVGREAVVCAKFQVCLFVQIVLH